MISITMSTTMDHSSRRERLLCSSSASVCTVREIETGGGKGDPDAVEDYVLGPVAHRFGNIFIAKARLEPTNDFSNGARVRVAWNAGGIYL